MTLGTKSLLFGAHWPPHIGMIALAWKWLYGSWPNPKEFLAICLHDIGYLGVKEMDGDDGTKHPELGAGIADIVLGKPYGDLIRGHSKGYAELIGVPLSKLYGPDKLSHAFEFVAFYTFRTRLTGELQQYKDVHHGCTPKFDNPQTPDQEWFQIVRARMAREGINAALEIIAPNGLGSHRGR